MPGKSELERALEQFRRNLLNKERRSASTMVRVYGQMWKQIKAELERLNTEYEAVKVRGEEPSKDWIRQFNRARAFRDQVERQLSSFAQYAEGKIRQEQYEAISAAEANAEALTRKALGKLPKGINIDWNRVPTGAIEEMVGLTQSNSPLHKLLMSISAEGAKGAENALIQGLLMGKNPRATAPLIRDALGIPLSRALMIARTETLRAYRTATQQNYSANSDVLEGWIWHSACDLRTCAMCWMMHGTVHPSSEPMEDHPNGRCSMMPRTKSWAEIGKMIGVDLSDLPDTRPAITPGIDQFKELSMEEQMNILGPAKWAAWKEGKFELSDLVGRKYDKVWGGMTYEKSLSEILGSKQAKIFTESTRTEIIGGVRIPYERRAHWRQRHPEITSDVEKKLLQKAITKPDYVQPSKSDPYSDVRYILDENNKWWAVVVSHPPGSNPFVLTFRRAHGKGK